MRPIEQQTILLTGATDGLGRALAADLAGRGATVLLHGRDDARGQAALDEVRRTTGSERLGWYRADLSSLDEVRELAAAVRRDHPELHALVNNAGIGTTVPGGEARLESADGHELRFAVNYLAGYLLTRLLTDPALDGVSGVYFNGLREAKANAQAYDLDARRRLHELSDRLTGVTAA